MASLPRHYLKPTAIPRIGFEYQDLIGIDLLIRFFRDPGLYLWVELESEDETFGYLDDVVAARCDGSLELIQVKFTVNPDEHFLDWDWLLAKKAKGTSLLAKWSDSLSKVGRLGTVHSARLRTNRRPDVEFANALRGHFIDLDLVTSDRKRMIETELGGSASAKEFFCRFEFSHSERVIDRLEAHLKGLIVPTDTDTNGWLLLREQARVWATKKLQPEPDGRIRHQHLVQIITKKRAQPIPQNFQIPGVYCVPSRSFHTDFIVRIKIADVPITVLWGSPGRGKSTYLSFLIEHLRKEGLPIIRHHYFLSLDDTTSDRVSFADIAASLMDQMIVSYPDAVRGLEHDANKLRSWIEACANHFSKEGKRLLVVVDGLDHVWKEQGNIYQMDHLFNYLLPCPPNVSLIVGTQRVPDNQLPNRLIQHVSAADWIEIPPMDEGAVHEWVTGQYHAGRLRLRDLSKHTDSQTEQLSTVARAFFEISRGHPLHLIYSFEALVRRGVVFTDEEIRLLPECPNGDIRKYYNGLWQRLSANAKQILHLIAGSDFHWPSDGIRRCVGAIDEVDHLLEHRRSGLMPFHGSILAYARERSDHEESFSALLPRIVDWLEREAPEFWRWGWLWLIKAKGSDYTQLLNGSTREWVIDSLTRGWPESQIVTILTEAERKAFKDRDYTRTIELRSLKTRVQNGPEYQMQSFPEFQECAIRAARNTQQILNMADRIAILNEKQILALARTTSNDTVDILTECIEELRTRVNLWLSLRHRPGAEFISLARHFIEVLALGPEINVIAIMRFVEGFHESDNMFLWLLKCLTRERRFGTLVEIAGRLKNVKNENRRLLTQDAMVRVAALEGIEIESRYRASRSVVSPLMACWLHLHKAPNQPTVAKPRIPNNMVQDHYSYGRNSDVETFFHDIFFCALAGALTSGNEYFFELPGADDPALTLVRDAVKILEDAARAIAEGRTQLSFSTPFSAARDIEPPTSVNPSEPISAQYHSFKHALRQIAIDLHCLKSSTGETPLVGSTELAIARSSAHWSEEACIADQVESRVLLLDPQAANDTLQSLMDEESGRISVFNERAEKWTELARFALLYDIPRAAELLSRAAKCIVGYGWRKDLWIMDVLDAIAEVHEHGAGDAFSWLQLLVPIVEQITEFTDGDETDYAMSELIDVVARVCPDRLPVFYAHHISQDEFRYADDALTAHCRMINFSSPVSIALAHTFVERRDVAFLGQLRKTGDVDAGRVEEDQILYLGGMPAELDRSPSSSDRFSRSGTPPDITQFGPSEFSALVEKVSDHTLGYEHQREALSAWLYHWKNKGRGLEALQSVRSYFEKEENPYSAESVLDDAFSVCLEIEGKRAAYPWLVMAHIHRHGWQSYWTSSEEVLRRLGWVSRHYKSNWSDFIYATSKPPRYWQRRKHDFAIGTRYLVHFLLLVGQNEVAARFADMCVRIVTAEVSDQPIPECPWFR